MKTGFRKSFTRDLKRIKDDDVRLRVKSVIEEVEAAETLQEVGNLKKMSGTDNFFRIRVGDYRIGVAVAGDTVDFVRCLPRKDLYRFFPWQRTPRGTPLNGLRREQSHACTQLDARQRIYQEAPEPPLTDEGWARSITAGVTQ